MTIKEMIEEMAKDILEIDVYNNNKCKDCIGYICNDHCDDDCFAKLSAKYFYNLHYRKIPEGSVVLDRQEHQKYCAYKIIEPQIKGCLDRERELEKQVAELEEQRDRQAYIAEKLVQEKHKWTEQARKETAIKIAFDIESRLAYYKDEDTFTKTEILLEIKELLKENGIIIDKNGE